MANPGNVKDKKMVMKFGKLYDSKTNQYQGEALNAGSPLFSRLEQEDKMYYQPSIYGFKDTEGNTSYYTGTAESKSMSFLKQKGTSRFLSNILQGFDKEFMDKTGFKKLDLPENMNIDEYYEKFFKEGKNPLSNKKADKGKMGSKIFNFLKKGK